MANGKFEKPAETADDPIAVRPWKDDYDKILEMVEESDRSRSEIIRDVIHRGLNVVYQEWEEDIK